ncbi:unannotated protein [freshwater metagenome]|uniref:Unannotated protein n=1 Tax=freshwater metagenome TaxID=449393 RepID=A0A6J6FIG6_9ZZZZ
MAHALSRARCDNMRSRSANLPTWNGDPLMLMFTRAPKAA